MSPRLVADSALVFATAVWGLSFLLVKDALGAADPFTFLALRFGLAAVVASLLAGRALWDRRNTGPALGLSFFLFTGFALQTWGLAHTTTARSAFITGLCVVLVPPFSAVLFRRLPRVPSIVGVLLSAFGLYVMTGGMADGEGGGKTFFGDALTLGCAVAYGFHIVFTERFAADRSPMALIALQFWGVTVSSALVLPFIDVRLESSATLWSGVVITGLFASVVAIGLQTWAQKRTTAVRAALIFSAEPVFAALFSYALRGESLTPRELLGCSVILFAILVSELGNAWLARRQAVGQAG